MTRDERIAAAVDDRDAVGFTQALAGAHELLEHYCTSNPQVRLVIEAAADARRLGRRHALPEVLLREKTDARWRAEQPPRAVLRPLPAGWFEDAVKEASRPLRTDGVQALFVIEDPDTGNQGYALADYLEQHLTRTRALTPIPDGFWDGFVACLGAGGLLPTAVALVHEFAPARRKSIVPRGAERRLLRPRQNPRGHGMTDALDHDGFATCTWCGCVRDLQDTA